MAHTVTTPVDDLARVAAKAAAAELATLELVKALSAVPSNHAGHLVHTANADEAVMHLVQVRAWANCEAAKLVAHEVKP